MTTTSQLSAGKASGPGGDGTAAGSKSWRPPRWLAWPILMLLVVLVAAIMVWQGPAPANDTPLDPRNPTPTGAQALARVLESRGVSVTVARGQSELARARVDPDTTVLVARTANLAQETVARLLELTADAQRLVVVDPDRWLLRYLSPGTAVQPRPRGAAELVATACGTSDVRPGETLSHSQSEFRDRSAAAGCFVSNGWSAYLALPARSGRAPLVLFGSASAMTNREIAQATNAAVVLRTLGHSSRLVWYVPSLADIPASDQSRTATLLPSWFDPALLLVAFATLAALLWRGRRLGALVREPLPVVISAVETTQSRGRIYRRAKDATRAGLVLQDATRRRLAAYLGLPVSASPDALVHAVCHATGRASEAVGSLLVGSPPSNDSQLLGFAVELQTLEKEVHRS